MDKTGRNGIRVGDIFAIKLEEEIQKLTQKHLEMLKAFENTIEFNLEEMETVFLESIKA